MLKKAMIVSIMGVVLVSFSSMLFAQSAPQNINYQGVLRDSVGSPVDGPFQMTFRLYDSPSPVTLLWEEQWNVTYPPLVTVTNGLFNVALGEMSHYVPAGLYSNFEDVFKNHTDVYLTVEVESDGEMAPFIKIISAPYALNAGTVDGLDSTAFANSPVSPVPRAN